MIFQTVLPIWKAVHERFYQVVEGLSDQDLQLKAGSSSVASLIRHSAEVEIIFADWFFSKKMPNVQTENSEDTVEEMLKALTASSSHLIEAMEALPEEAWHQSVDSQMGTSTPLEAIGRLTISHRDSCRTNFPNIKKFIKSTFSGNDTIQEVLDVAKMD